MPLVVNREQVLHTLENVSPGLSQREIVEQSNCFILTKKEVIAFNDEVACRAPNPFKDITGAMPAEKLLELLRKLPDDDLEVRRENGELLIKGKGKARRAGIRLEEKVTLPIDTLEKPTEWQALHEDFGEAIGTVQQCASQDQSRFEITCVHIHPKWVEAYDVFQICRWRLPTGVQQSVLVRQSSIQHIATAGMTEFAETEGFIHFRNPAGLILSCRRYLEEFPEVGKWLKMEGDKVKLPKGLAEACEKSEIFSKENGDINLVTVKLAPGKLTVRGQGVSGWYEETKKCQEYNGNPIEFMVSPTLLTELVKKHNDCLINSDQIKVEVGRYVWTAVLVRPDEASGEEETEGGDTNEEGDEDERGSGGDEDEDE